MRLLILRTSALGDIVHCLPVLSALRRHAPQAHIGWVLERTWIPLLEDHALIDEILPVATKQWRKRGRLGQSVGEILATRRRLREFRADAVLDLMGTHKSGVLARFSGCRRRIGLRKEDRREPSSALWINHPVPARGVHAVDRALSVLAGLDSTFEQALEGSEAVDFRGELLLPEPPPEAARLLSEAPDNLAVILPGTAWGNKTYPAERWGEVARLLRDSVGLTPWVPAGPGEEPLAQSVADASDGAARALGLVDLPTLAALCRRSRLVLGGDTGPTHLAHAVGAPVLELMGPTDPSTHGPYAAPHRALARRLPCSFCHKRFGETKACLWVLSPAEVAARAVELLEDGSGGGDSSN
ncbi:MAG: glycosyltransferase family 9 protein [Acidobacteriota bacterium]|nr:glycosyltransferase family 9 protein [Acidobacteriota bacterium]